MRFDRPTARGRLRRRYARFLADVELVDGRELTVHCPNPGSMLGLDSPGSEVLVSDSENEKRKLRWTLELVRPSRSWVCVNTARANQVVAEALAAGRIPALAERGAARAEVKYGEGSRADFLLEGPCGRTWVEVKSVTLARGRTARFPDSVTARGLKHLRELAGRVAAGDRAALLLLVARGDCRAFEPAEDIDPAWAAGLREAAAAGVEVLVHRARVGPGGLRLDRALPWRSEGS